LRTYFRTYFLTKINLEKNIKRIGYGNYTKYVNCEFFKFLSRGSIVHELTCVNISQIKLG